MHNRLTVKPLLHPRQREDGTHQVRVRLTQERISIFLDSGFNVLTKHWNPKSSLDNASWIRRGEPLHEEMNNLLTGLLLRAHAFSGAYPSLTIYEVRDLLRLPVEESADDLKRLRKLAEHNRRTAANTPIVLRHYTEVVQKVRHLERELKEIKTQLSRLMNKK
jgi:pyruvate dehydrogenase complex dehydrogenase (E1) component